MITSLTDLVVSYSLQTIQTNSNGSFAGEEKQNPQKNCHRTIKKQNSPNLKTNPSRNPTQTQPNSNPNHQPNLQVKIIRAQSALVPHKIFRSIPRFFHDFPFRNFSAENGKLCRSLLLVGERNRHQLSSNPLPITLVKQQTYFQVIY